jgi:hypothetical protein
MRSDQTKLSERSGIGADPTAVPSTSAMIACSQGVSIHDGAVGAN